MLTCSVDFSSLASSFLQSSRVGCSVYYLFVRNAQPSSRVIKSRSRAEALVVYSVDDPFPIFSAAIFLFGTLFPANDDNPIEPEMIFRLAINAVDSALWLVFEFHRYTHLGCDKYIIGEVDEWGKLFAGDVPFTAGKNCGFGSR